MVLLSIAFFLITTFGFGLSVSFLAKESDDLLERILMRFGMGLALMVTFGYIFNSVRIPLDWKIFLFTAILIISIKYTLDFKKNKLFNVKLNFNFYAVIMLILFALTLSMYVKGAFAYPYLEDDDSWSHATSVKFVSVEKTVSPGENNFFNYLDPYPPAYAMLLGVIHQTNDSVYWTLKYFNALIISLSIIFFYFFTKVFLKSSKKALFSTFALFAIPAYLSHFIWALALTMPLVFVAFYSVEKIRDDKKWWIITALVMMSALTSSPTHSAYFALLFAIYFITRVIVERKILVYEGIAAAGGIALSYLLWWLPMFMAYTFNGTLMKLGIGAGPRGSSSIFKVIGTGDRIYNLNDFVYAKSQNMINNPIGIGLVLSILTVIGLVILISNYKKWLKKYDYSKLVIVAWFLFAFYAVNAARFTIKLSPFRAWIILAIPVALLSAEATSFIETLIKSVVRSFMKVNKQILLGVSLAVLCIIAYGVVQTSYVQKYAVNTANWPPGAFWTSNEEIQGYVWLFQNIPRGTNVFTFANNGPVIGLDKYTCHWCLDVREFQRTGINKPSEEVYKWLKEHNYEYLIIDGQTAQKFGSNSTSVLLEGLGENQPVQIAFQNSGFILLKI
jgi:hypothetical protein